ncbi:DUF6303 family protein [Streptomyces sp. NPDC005148]
MPTTLPAQMSNSGGSWHLYVPLMGTPSPWPEHDWKRATPTPTLEEREHALNGLGYEVPPGAEWSWIEDSDAPADPGAPVRLIATVTAWPTTGGGAR